MSDMMDRLDRDAEPWKPSPGDKLTGTVASVEIFTGQYGDYPLLLVVGDDGTENAVHAFHTVLRSELARKQPKPGDRIGIKYVGKDTEKGYERYRVVLDSERPAGVDWSQVARVADGELGDDTPPDREPPDDYRPDDAAPF